MSVRRRVNWLSEIRADLPAMKSMESATSNDFDELIQSFVTGPLNSYIMRGFELSMSGAIGGAASSLEVVVDPGAVFHVTSSVSGTFYQVSTGTPNQQLNSATNTIVNGAFSPNSINYVALEYQRFNDTTTNAQSYFWAPSSNTETTQTVPQAQILRYTFNISTSTPTSYYLPLFIVQTDSSNNVISITDARPMLFRLGTGGFNPNPFYVYPWTADSAGRTENPSSSSSNAVSPFEGGDKQLGTLKDWMSAVMSQFQEIKGTTYWYSLSNSGSLSSIREDLGNTVITGKGYISHGKDSTGAATVAGQINWSDDINIKVISSELTYTLTANPTSNNIILSDDQVAYITLVRDVAITPNLIFTNSSPTVNSVGNVAWTSPLQQNDWIRLASDTHAGYYQIDSINSSTQVTLTSNFTETSTGSQGAKSVYAFGSYQSAATPTTNRNIYIASRGLVPSGQDVFWLFMRNDNGGAAPKVYIRFLGSEIDQGETEEISDNKSQETLKYIGAPLESSSAPMYVSALNPGSLPEITNITFPAQAGVTNSGYFFDYSSGASRTYYFYANVNSSGVDPMPQAGAIGVEISIPTGATAAQIAALAVTAYNSTAAGDFSAVAGAGGLITVTNTSAGTTTSPANISFGSMTIAVTQSGTGVGNYAINDGDNLTLAIKKLDQAMASFASSLTQPTYDEILTITTATAAGSTITLPLNSRLSNIQGKYEVGHGALEIYLNGVYLVDSADWSEIGAAQSASSTITTNVALVPNDVLHFRLGVGGGGGSGGQGIPGEQGVPGQSGQDAIGGPISVSTKTGNYTVLTSDKLLLADCTSNSVTFTLPAASANTGRVFLFKKIDATSNAMVIAAAGADLIDGASSQTRSIQYQAMFLACDGQKWILI